MQSNHQIGSFIFVSTSVK